MAEVDVRKHQKEEKSVAHQGGGEIANRGGWDPLAWWRTPSEFFSDPFSLMRRMREDMDRAFARGFGDEGGAGAGGWSPAVEVREHNGELHVHAELPGIKPEDVKVEVTDDSLVIQGERRYEHEEKNKGVFRSERRYGHFYREIPLPEGADAENAKAQFNNGVLEVSLPVPERKSNRRQIPVGSGEHQTVGSGRK